jgi:hypothetical protein
MPKSSGKLDKTPNVMISPGQTYVTCGGTEKTRLVFFIHLRWMPFQEIFVWSGEEKPSEPARMFGKEFTVTLVAPPPPPGSWDYHQLNILVGERTYTVGTILADCQAVSAAPGWNFGDTANGSVELVVG